jgi:site-specific DNA-methyltransferase (adenine-specific)
MGTLYYGDNLKWLRHAEYFPNASADLVYLDPPFKSDANYNAFFQGKTGAAASQIKAFEDTWQWVNKDNASMSELQAIIADERTPDAVKKLLRAYHDFLGGCDMMAYLMMMAPRLVELHRVLKPTGSLYLHCDPTASHYLKLLLDAAFGPNNYRNEITWKRRVGMSSAVHESNRFGICTDIILFYAKSDETEFHPQYNLTDPDYRKYIEERFTYEDENGRKFQPTSLVNPAYRPNLIYEYKGYKPSPNGWMITKENIPGQ